LVARAGTRLARERRSNVFQDMMLIETGGGIDGERTEHLHGRYIYFPSPRAAIKSLHHTEAQLDIAISWSKLDCLVNGSSDCLRITVTRDVM
jgi:hypothetical protein